MSLLPPEGKYNSEEAFVAAMRTFTARRGYALVIGSSYKFHDKRNVYYQCDRGGKHRDNHRVKPDDRVRNRSSRVSGCPFRLKLQEQDDGSFWLWHDINSAKHTHNHALSTVATVHPSLRKLNDADRIEIVRQTSVGITPKQILALQQPGPSNLRSLPRDIYNMSAKARREASHCSEPPETLLNFLRSEQYQVAVRSERLTATTSRMTGILFSHPTAITLTNRFPLAITIDATYKTNRYGMPLVHIIGLTSTNATFCSAVALITREREEDYVWLLREYLAMMGGDLPVHVMITDRDAALGAAIKQIFPQAQHNLCRWHINKNITTNCKAAFDDEETFHEFLKSWSQLVSAGNETEYGTMVEALSAALSGLPQVQEYINNLLEWREHYVSAWTDKHLHLNSTSSSRVEGAHHSFKKFLNSSVGDLPLLGRRLHDHFVLQQVGIYHVIENDRRSISVRIGALSLFAEVRGNISSYAMNLAYEQMSIANRFKTLGSAPCSSNFSASMGIPCAHQIGAYLDDGLPLPMDSFNKQWWLELRTEQTPISQRMVAPARRVTSTRINSITGTQRLPSAFERAEAEGGTGVRRAITCSQCEQAGHNSRNLNCPYRYSQAGGDQAGPSS